MIEEMLRAALWFNPAVWWLIDRVHAAREEVVDAEAVLYVDGRRSYISALLAFADAPAVAAAPAFAHRRHLFSRIKRLCEESTMSSRRFLITSSLLTLAIATSTVYAVSAFPLRSGDDILHCTGRSWDRGGGAGRLVTGSAAATAGARNAAASRSRSRQGSAATTAATTAESTGSTLGGDAANADADPPGEPDLPRGRDARRNRRQRRGRDHDRRRGHRDATLASSAAPTRCSTRPRSRPLNSGSLPSPPLARW